MKATAGYGGAEQAADLVSGEHVAGPRSISRGSALLPTSVILKHSTLIIGPPLSASQASPLRTQRAQVLPAC